LEIRSRVQSLAVTVADTKALGAQRNSKLDEICAMKEEIERQHRLAKEEISQLESRLSELKSAEQALRVELDRQKALLAELEKRNEQNTTRRNLLDRKSAQISEQEALLLGNARRIEGRLGGLECVAAEHREQNQLIRSVLGRVRSGVVGLLEDLASIPPELSSAFDALLYEYGAIVIAANRDAALSCVSALNEVSRGRFTVLVNNDQDQKPCGKATPDLLSCSEVVGEAIDLICCPEDLKPAISSLLGGTVVVETAQSMRNLRDCSEYNVKFVTRKGELIQRGSLFIGGGGSAPGGLGVKAELDKASAELGDVQKALSECASEKSILESEASEVERLRDSLGCELRDLSEKTAANENSIEVRNAETALIEARIESLRMKEKDLEGRLLAYSSQREALDRDVSELELSLRPTSDQLEAQTSLARDLEGQREAMLARMGELRMEEVRQLARKNGLVSLKLRLEEEKALLVAEIDRKREGLETTSSALAESEGELGGLEKHATEEAGIGQEKKGRLDAARTDHGTVRSEIEELERALKIHRTELERLSEEAHAIELDLTKHKIEREGVSRRIYSDHGVDLTDNCRIPEGFDPVQAEQRAQLLRQKMRGLGPVNLLALEEYEKKKERLDFMRNQRDDLIQAKTSLLEVIEKINQRASSLFLETFNSIQEKFQETFLTLFEGGAAELRLLGDDPLEADIEMVARPKGKTLQSLHLLSGGERALTAIALLFAIYLVKPSPFCILDELDAPLDDANINRFLNMLKKFNDKTQFIVITHNKKTMEIADCLYGITMQEPGISKIVSVRFKDSEDAVEDSREAVAVET